MIGSSALALIGDALSKVDDPLVRVRSIIAVTLCVRPAAGGLLGVVDREPVGLDRVLQEGVVAFVGRSAVPHPAVSVHVAGYYDPGCGLDGFKSACWAGRGPPLRRIIYVDDEDRSSYESPARGV